MPTTMMEMLALNSAITAKAKIQPNRMEIPSHNKLRFLAIVNIKMLNISTIARAIERKLSFFTCWALVTAIVGAPTAEIFTFGWFSSVKLMTLSIKSTKMALFLVSLQEKGEVRKANALLPASLNRYSSSTR